MLQHFSVVFAGSYAKQGIFAYESVFFVSSYAKQGVFAYESRANVIPRPLAERISFIWATF